MPSVNRIMILGNLGANPVSTITGIVSLSVATNEKTTTGSETTWHRVSLFGGLAETALKYLKKGDPVYIEGKISYNFAETSNGRQTRFVNIYADKLTMMGRPTAEAKIVQKNILPSPECDDDIPF